MRRYSNLRGGMGSGNNVYQAKGGRIKEKQLKAEHLP